MKPQRQLIAHRPDEGLYGDCQRTCIAAILDMDAADVPHFCDPPHHEKGHPEHWEAQQNRWLEQFGLASMTVAYSGDTATFDDVMNWTSRQSPTVPMILCGRSNIGSNHRRSHVRALGDDAAPRRADPGSAPARGRGLGRAVPRRVECRLGAAPG